MKTSLHLTHTDPRFDSRILKEIDVLANSNHKIIVLGIASRENRAVQRKNTGNISFRIINLGSRRFIFFPERLRHILNYFELTVKTLLLNVPNNADLIHCHDFTMLPIAVLLKRICGCKLIYDAHELESNTIGMSSFMGKLVLKVERILWPFIDALITVSPSIDTWYQNELGEKTSSVILNSPMLPKYSHVKSDYLRKHFDIPDDRKIFIYVGALRRGRGLELISKVFSSSLVDSHLVFLGYGDLEEWLHNLSAIHSNIHLHREVPHDEVVSIIRSADFGLCLIENVSLSYFYSLPNKLFEYLFAGLPVLASNFPDIASLLLKVEGGLCCDIDEDSITESVLSLEKKFISFHIRNLDAYCWDAQADRLIKMYHYLLKPR